MCLNIHSYITNYLLRNHIQLKLKHYSSGKILIELLISLINGDMIHNLKSLHICFMISDTYPQSVIRNSILGIVIIKLRLPLAHLTVSFRLKLILQKYEP